MFTISKFKIQGDQRPFLMSMVVNEGKNYLVSCYVKAFKLYSFHTAVQPLHKVLMSVNHT